ncbi:hypothetical protein [Shewanella sp. KT0246]|uniref:hypothetical protein n=1 Tax=Shewanella sp. KT0246 TaxID=2815912 RepID=UPI001BC6A372|nr:hypothetical protein [Shewanella sp. KT0246]GIU52713.1 hypothetical protein TUM4249_24080 [Shewanella sp. KT0246]
MYNHLFSQPVKYQINQGQTLLIALAEDVSDFILLPALSQPLAEIIICESHCAQSASFILTCQPFFKVEVLDERLNFPAAIDPAVIDEAEIESDTESSPQAINFTFNRALGQGFRLYAKIGIAPRISAQSLRKGVGLSFDVKNLSQNLVSVSYQHSVCESVNLEQDLRLNQEPKELMMAKAILARNFDYEEPPATLALNISEIEQVRADINLYLSQTHHKVHAVIAAQLLKLDNLLNHKQQWLLRTYSQSQQRTNYATAANELSKDVEDLQRKLECFTLLAPADVSLMVDKLTEET